MKLLLTSSGITNGSIEGALVELLGKPISESSALCIPTGVQPFPGGPSHVYKFIAATGSDEALALVDFAVFPHLDREDGLPPAPSRW